MAHPNYSDLLRKNLKNVIESNGGVMYRGLKSMTSRQLYRIHTGESNVTVGKLNLIADELGIDMMEFFRT